MNSFIIEKNNRKFKVYVSPDGFSSYEFTIYEIIPKKHWWSFGKKHITCGTAWYHIKKEVLEKLNQYLTKEERIMNLNKEFENLCKQSEVEIMDMQQKKLLHDIADWHMREFYNRMNDHWNTEDFDFDTKCTDTINKLESEYKNKYGELPEWNNVDDVQNALSQLKKELGDQV